MAGTAEMGNEHWTHKRNPGGWRNIPLITLERPGSTLSVHPIRGAREEYHVAREATRQGAHWMGTSPQDRDVNQYMLCWLGFAYAIVYGDKKSSLSRIHNELSGSAVGDERTGRYRKRRKP